MEPCRKESDIARLNANYDTMMDYIKDIKEDIKEIKKFMLETMPKEYAKDKDFRELKEKIDNAFIGIVSILLASI